MNLGEQIRTYRNKLHMSQDALAEQLGVSRQSVSKWETNTATPELDKLMAMSKLFGITLDQLVNGPPQTESHDPPPSAPPPAASTGVRKITGYILLCFGQLLLAMTLFSSHPSALLSCLAYSLPLLVCAAICLSSAPHPLLFCFLALYLLSWLPLGILPRNYIRGDIAKWLQSFHILWGLIQLFAGLRLQKRNSFLKSRHLSALYYGTLAATILISYLFLRFPALLPTPGLLHS